MCRHSRKPKNSRRMRNRQVRPYGVRLRAAPDVGAGSFFSCIPAPKRAFHSLQEKNQMSKIKDYHPGQYQRRVRIAISLYFIWCAVVIVYTLFRGCRGNVLTTSMSVMGNQSTVAHLSFIVWTIVFCSYFGSLTGFILILTHHIHSKIRVFVYIAVAIMIVGDVMPFVPEVHPVAAFMHNTCAQISSISLALTLLLLAITIRKAYPDIYSRAIIWVFIIWAALLGGMALIGTKALTEMMGIIGGSVYLWVLASSIAKSKKFNASAALSAADAAEAMQEADRLEEKARALQEEYLKAQAAARQARLAADELRRVERYHQLRGE